MRNFKETFGNSSSKFIYSVNMNGGNILIYKYRILKKEVIRHPKKISKWGSSPIHSEIKYTCNLVEYMGASYTTSHNTEIIVPGNVDAYYKDYTCNFGYFCNIKRLNEYLSWKKRVAEDNIYICNKFLNPINVPNTEGIFEDAKAGDTFETADGRIAHYLEKNYSNHDIRPEMEYHLIFIEGIHHTICYKSNGKVNSGYGSAQYPEIIKKITK